MTGASGSPALVATFRVAGLHLGIDVAQVIEVLPGQSLVAVPLAPDGVAGIVNVRGRVLTVIEARTRLGLDPRPPDQQPANLLVDCDDEVRGLLVDAVADVRELDPAQRRELPDTLGGPLRAAVLGAYRVQEDVLLVVDARTLIEGVVAGHAGDDHR